MDQLFEKNLMTTKDAGELSGYSPDYLARLARSGKIIGKRVGHSWLVDKDSLTLFLSQQGDRKIDYARALARAREAEYRARHSFSHRVSGALSKPLSAPFSRTRMDSLRTQAIALSVAGLVVVFGAFVAQAATLTSFVAESGALARETAVGFHMAFGNIPARVVAELDQTSHEMRMPVLRVARDTRELTARLAFNFEGEVRLPQMLSKSDFQNTDFQNVAQVEVRLPQGQEKSDFHRVTFDPQKIISDTIAFISSPAKMKNVLENNYLAMGTAGYEAIQNSLTAYNALVHRAGASSLVLAASARDAGAAAPAALLRSTARVSLALGNTVVNASRAAIRAETGAAYGLAEELPKGARRAVALVVIAGDMLASAAAHAPALATTAFLRATEVPATVGPALAQAIFNVEYAGAERFISASNSISERYLAFVNSSGNLALEIPADIRYPRLPSISDVRNVRIAFKDAYLGALGTLALALENQPFRAALAAVEPGFSFGEQAALATYQALNNFFASTSRALATLIAPPPTIVMPAPMPVKQRVAATPTPAKTSPTYQTYQTYPTYSTIVKGVSQESLDQSLIALRNDVLATVSGMVRPVAAQTITNATTIQQVNMIQKLDGLTVTKGIFQGGIFDSGIRVAATDGSFTNLIASVTNFGTTDISGTLSVAGQVSAPYFTATSTTATSTFAGPLATSAYVSSPYFIATSTTATSTFAGGLAVGEDTFVVDSTAGNVGIASTSPSASLSVNGTSHISGESFFGGALTATSSLAFTNFTGILSSNGTSGVSARTLTGTDNQITIVNGDGTAGNPTFSLPSLLSITYASSTALSALNTLSVGQTATTTIAGDNATSTISGQLVVRGATDQPGWLTIQRGGNNLNNTLSFNDDVGTSLLQIYTDANTGYGRIVGRQTYLTLGTGSGGTAISIYNTTDNSLRDISITGHLIPTANETFNLGSPALYWGNGYINNIVANNLSSASTSIAGTNTTSFSINSNNPTADTEDMSLIFYRGAGAPSNGVLSWNASLDRFEFNQNLYLNNAATSPASTTLRIAAVAGQTGALTSWLDSDGNVLNTITASGNVGIGTTTPYAKLSVAGRGVFNQDIRADYFTATSTTLASTFTYASTTALTVSGASGLSLGSLTGPLQAINGAVTASSTLSDFYVSDALTIAGGTISGTSNTMSLGSDATGDIYYRDASGYLARLGLGTGGYVLASSGGLPAWVASTTLSTITGTLSVDKGGTGAATLTGLLQGNGTNAITGITGTAGQFPYYNGASTLLATSTIFLSTAGNVGIGTTNPGTKFQVKQGSAEDVTQGISVVSYGGASTGVIYSNNSSMILREGGVDTMYIKAGNVGIGTTGPGAKLDVVKNTYGVGILSAIQDVMVLNAGPQTESYNDRWAVGAGVGMTFYMQHYTSGTSLLSGRIAVEGTEQTASAVKPAMVFHTGNAGTITEKMRITYDGNVGIGTTSPIDILNLDRTSGQNALRFSDGGTLRSLVGVTNAAGQLLSAAADNDLVIRSESNLLLGSNGDNTRVYIKSDGNVGIGTTTPLAKLVVEHNDVNVARFISTSSRGPTIALYNAGGQIGVLGTYAALTGSGTDMTPSLFAETGLGLNFLVNGSATRAMVIEPTNGNVGIGTTTPGNTLQVGGIGTTNYAGNEFALGDGTRAFAIDMNTTGSNLYSSSNMTFNIGVAEKVRIDTNGNVGIGTTSPSSLLSVHGNSYVSGTSFFGGAIVATSTLSVQSTTATSTFSTGGLTVGTSQFVVQQTSGNVGIGTTSPVSKLSVVGESALAGGLSVGLGYAGTAAPSNGLIIQGNVGIGTTAPGALLHVSGSAASNGVVRVTNAVNSTDVNHGSLNIINSKVAAIGDDARIMFTFITDPMASIGAVREDTAYAAALQFNTRSAAGDYSEKVRITNQGNVGIGTTGPLTPLHVYSNGTLVSGTQYATLLAQNGSGSYGVALDYDTTNTRGIIRATGTNADLDLQVAGTGDVLIRTGNVGIGTTTPYSRLSVWGNGTGATSMFELTNSASTTLASVLNDGTFYMKGNVGIGTTGPGAKLDVLRTGSSFTQVANFYDTSADGYPYISVGDGTNGIIMGHNNVNPLAASFGWISYTGLSPQSGDGIIIKSNGNVGIGTTTPSSLLSVHGNSYVSGTSFFGGAIVATSTLSVQSTTATSTFSTGGLTVGTSQFVVQQTSGNVGIGTTNPTGLLHLAKADTTFNLNLDEYSTTQTKRGVLAFRKSASNTNGTIVQTASGDLLGQISAQGAIGATFDSTAGINFYQDGAPSTRIPGRIEFFTSSATEDSPVRMVIKNDGNVGIGTTSPNAKLNVYSGATGVAPSTNADELVVEASGVGGISILTPDASNSLLYFGSLTDNIGALLQWNYDASAFTIGANKIGASLTLSAGDGVPNLTLSGATGSEVASFTGNVGIGTTTPYSRLSVWGNGTGATSMFELTNSASTTLASVLNDGTFYMKGNVGIGTTGPGAKLDVVKNTYGVGILSAIQDVMVLNAGPQTESYNDRWAVGAGVGMTFYMQHYTSGTSLLSGRIAVEGTEQTASAVKPAMVFHTGNAGTITEKMRITYDGNVGIGTTNPGAKLAIKDTSDFNLNIGTNTAGNGFNIFDVNDNLFLSSNANIRIVLDHNNDGADTGVFSILKNGQTGTELFRVQENGNVGIGTTNPVSMLDVLGSMTVGTSTYARSTDATYDLNINGATGNKLRMIKNSIVKVDLQVNGTSAASTDRRLSFVDTDNSAVVPLTVMLNGTGNVGIGTTSPYSMLSVAGQIVGQNFVATSTTATSTFSGGLSVGNNGALIVNQTAAANSLYINSSGNVGIGTTNPLALLQVGHTAYGANVLGYFATDASHSSRVSVNASGYSVVLGSVGSGGTPINGIPAGASGVVTETAYPLVLGTNNTEWMRITSTGNVGIGTTGPGANLHVLASTGYGTIRLAGAASAGGTVEFYSQTTALADIFANPTKDLIFRTNGATEQMRILSTGNVGIGTTNPGVKLDVAGTDNGINSLFRTVVFPSSPAAGDGTAVSFSARNSDGAMGTFAIGQILGVADNVTAAAYGGYLSFKTRTNAGSLTEQVRITGGGNVGIGTTTPDTALHLSRTSGNTVIKLDNTVTTAVSALELYQSNAVKAALTYHNSAHATKAGLTQLYADGALTFYAGAAEKVRIQTDGNVGIGTTSPGYKLDIGSGDLNIATGNMYMNGTSPIIYYTRRIVANSQDFAINNNANNANNLYITDAGDTTVRGTLTVSGTGNSSITGNVGIGNVNPTRKLHVEGSAAVGTVGTEPILVLGRALSAGVSFQQSASFNLGRYAVPGGAFESYSRLDIALRDNESASNYNTNNVIMTLQSNGNVGIGTTTPASKLDLNGYLSFNSVSSLSTFTQNAGKGILLETTYGRNDLEFLTSSYGSGYGFKFYSVIDDGVLRMAARENTTSWTDMMSFKYNGNVGIGTTNPLQKLHVEGTDDVFSLVKSTGADSRAAVLVQNDARQWLMQVEGANSDNFELREGVGGNTWLSVRATTGNVGIGTTSPVSKLSVVGESALAGGLSVGLGYAGTAAPSNGLIIQGNVGIGTTGPTAPVEIKSSGTDRILRVGAGGSAGEMFSVSNEGGTPNVINAYIAGGASYANAVKKLQMSTYSNNSNHILSSENAYLKLQTGSSEALALQPTSGNVGIGTTSPATLLEVGGSTANVTFDGYKTCVGFTSDANGLLACTASDERLKQNITSLATSSVLAAFDTLRPVSFAWRPETNRGAGEQFGLIAQEVQSVFPNLVVTSSPTALTPEGTLSVNYEGLISPMILAIQELNARMGRLQDATGVLNTESGVESQCVTGDTKLRRRKKKNGKAQSDGNVGTDFELIAIADVVAGDEIASLDERTGKVAYARVNALKDMGVQEVFELRTASGRVIRTTGNHPYLVRAGAAKP